MNEEEEEEVHSTDKNEIKEEGIPFEDNLANAFKNNFKMVVDNQLSDIGPTPYKVAIVGMNELGSATAFLLICRQVVTDIILIDRNPQRLAAEYADLSTCTTFVSGVNVQASTQLPSCEGARVIILCDVDDDDDDDEGKKPMKSHTSSENQKFLSNFTTVSRAVNIYAPDCVIIIAIQPFEIFAQLCASHSGLPSHRILAPGTMIDSAHLRLLIGEKLEISPSSITSLIIGAHGHDNLALWNSVTVGGIHLLSENPSIGKSTDKENWSQLHTNVNQRVEQINKLKGTEVWSISMATSELVECILRNKRDIHPVTVNIKGYYDVQTDLFLSIPAIVGQNGVSHLFTTNFNHSANENQFSKIIEKINLIIKEKSSDT